MGNLSIHPTSPSQGRVFFQELNSFIQQGLPATGRNSTKATLSIAAGETLFPSLACKCCSVSVKSPDISSWKNPIACVRTGLKTLAWAQTKWLNYGSEFTRCLSIMSYFKKKKKKKLSFRRYLEKLGQKGQSNSYPPFLGQFIFILFFFLNKI